MFLFHFYKLNIFIGDTGEGLYYREGNLSNRYLYIFINRNYCFLNYLDLFYNLDMMAGTSTRPQYNISITLPIRIKSDIIQMQRDLSSNSSLVFLSLFCFLCLKMHNLQKKHALILIGYIFINSLMMLFLLGLSCHSNNKCELQACTKISFFLL